MFFKGILKKGKKSMATKAPNPDIEPKAVFQIILDQDGMFLRMEAADGTLLQESVDYDLYEEEIAKEVKSPEATQTEPTKPEAVVGDKCPTCDGTGLKDSDTLCTKCSGSGKVN